MRSTGQRLLACATGILLLLLWTGCAKWDESGPGYRPGELSSRPAPAAAGEPPPVADTLAPPFTPGLPEQVVERFDIDVHEVAARTFFMELVRDSANNMTVHPGVGGTLSLSLRNVTLLDVLETVRDVYGYDFRETPAGWQVYPAALQSRMFNVDYLDVQRDGSSETRVSAGTIVDGGGGGSGSHISTRSESRFWADLEASVKQILVGSSAAEVGSREVVVNSKSGLIMVRALPGELREVETFLSALQNSAMRQVLLEAKIIEVKLSEGFQAGIDWTGIFNLAPDIITLNQAGASMGTSASQLQGGVFTLGVDLPSRNFQAVVELLQTQGDVHVLSSPQVVTTNNQKALIKIGSDEYFVTDVSFTTTTSGTDRNVIPDFELTPFFSGIALDVTPKIMESNDVILHIRPSISVVRDQVKTFTVAGSTQSLPLAHSRTRESDSIVRARSGEIIIIGGLMEEDWRDDRASVPGLGGIPLLGNLFTQRKWSKEKSELVIMLRPVVLDQGRDWRGSISLRD